MNFLNIFTNPPGDLLYFIIVIVASLIGLFMAAGQRIHRHGDYSAGRYTLAAFGVVVTWGLLLGGALLALFFRLDGVTIMPPLERAANVLTILLLAWAFLTADHQQWGRASVVVLAFLIAVTNIAYVITAGQWIGLAGQVDFNATAFVVAWTFTPLLVTLVSILVTLVYFRLVFDAPLKLVFFTTLAVGYGATLAQLGQGGAGTAGDYPGLVRFAFVVAMGVSPAIIYRAITARLVAEAEMNAALSSTQPMPAQTAEVPAVKESAPSRPSFAPIERESVQLLRALGLILEKATPGNVPTQVVNAILEILRADVGAILRIQDANYADITTVYDRAMKRTMSGISVNLDNQPTLTNAIERRAQRPLFEDRNPEELNDLYTRLDISQIGPVYFQPLIHDGQMIAILMVALPYTKRELVSQEEEILKGVAVIAAGLLALSYMATESSMLAEERAIQAMVQGVPSVQVNKDSAVAARQEMQATLQLAREQIAELTRQVVTLKMELERERSRVADTLADSEDGLSVSQRIRAISAEQDHLRAERDDFASRLKEAEAALAGVTAPDDEVMLKSLVRSLSRERENLLLERDRLQQQIAELRSNVGALSPDDLDALVSQIDQENVRLETERNQLTGRLMDIHKQLQGYGLEEGIAGVGQFISQLLEQRAGLQSKATELERERDALLSERSQLSGDMAQVQERESRFSVLQNQLRNLASDREVAVRQREQIRQERDEANVKLEQVKTHRARLLAQVSGFEIEIHEIREELARTQSQVAQISDERSDLLRQLTEASAQNQTLAAQVGQDPARSKQIEQSGLNNLQTMVNELSHDKNVLERELNRSRMALVNLENQLEAMRARQDQGLNGAASSSSEVAHDYVLDDAEMFMGLVQELRTPLTSIYGYVDLLLGESPGILGQMQRQFLQRVASNIQRLTLMIEDLIRMAALDTGSFTLEKSPLDLVSIIDDAITNASIQFREKGLMLTLNLEEDLPHPVADRDAITQVVGQLLSNAYLVSPPGTEIIVTALRRSVQLDGDGRSKPVDCVYVSIEDRGGGITPGDEARVFARKYKADNPLIQGLGDTGVGLSVAKVLVENHQGQLWLDNIEHVGSRFNFVLPINPIVETVAETGA